MDVKYYVILSAILAILIYAGYEMWSRKRDALAARRWIVKYPFSAKKGDIIVISNHVTNDPKIPAARHQVRVIKVFNDRQRILVESAYIEDKAK